MIISSDNTVKLGHISLPVLADESVFSPLDALKICPFAETYGVECMIGCMLEGKISASAAGLGITKI